MTSIYHLLYIEFQGNWTHGKHPYTGLDDDLEVVSKWKEQSKTKPYYKNAIYTWTDLDIRKRNIAKENNLNYIELFSKDIDSCISYITDYIHQASPSKVYCVYI